MEIESKIFDEFYDIIFSMFIEQFVPKTELRKGNRRAAYHWDIKVDGVYPSNELFGSFTIDKQIFYRRRGEIRSAERLGKKGVIEDDLFIAGLEYIGVELTDEQNILYALNPTRKVKLLYLKFLEKYLPTHFSAVKDSFIEDDDNRTNESPYNRRGSSQQLIDLSKLNEETIIYYIPNNINVTTNDFLDIEAVIKAFFYWITQSEYEKAYLLTDRNSFDKGMRELSLKQFIKGYKDLGSIKKIHIWGYRFDAAKRVSCNVYFECFQQETSLLRRNLRQERNFLSNIILSPDFKIKWTISVHNGMP